MRDVWRLFLFFGVVMLIAAVVGPSMWISTNFYRSDDSPLEIDLFGPEPGSGPQDELVVFEVRYNHAAVGATVADFDLELEAGSTVTAVIERVERRQRDFRTHVFVRPTGGQGNVNLAILDSGSIKRIRDASVVLGLPGAVARYVAPGGGFDVDTTIPTIASVTRVNASPTTASDVSFLVVFTKFVQGLNVLDFVPVTVPGGDATAISPPSSLVVVEDVPGEPNDPTEAVVTFSGVSGDGQLGLAVLERGTVTDLVGHVLDVSLFSGGGEEYAVVNSGPVATSIERVGAELVPLGTTEVQWLLTFNTPVVGLLLADFQIASIGLASADLTGAPVTTDGGLSFTVSAENVAGRGYLSLDFGPAPGVTDPVTGLPVTRDFGTGGRFAVDDTVPEAPVPLAVRRGTFVRLVDRDVEHFPAPLAGEPLDVDPSEYELTRFFTVAQGASAYVFQVTVDHFVFTPVLQSVSVVATGTATAQVVSVESEYQSVQDHTVVTVTLGDVQGAGTVGVTLERQLARTFQDLRLLPAANSTAGTWPVPSTVPAPPAAPAPSLMAPEVTGVTLVPQGFGRGDLQIVFDQVVRADSGSVSVTVSGLSGLFVREEAVYAEVSSNLVSGSGVSSTVHVFLRGLEVPAGATGVSLTAVVGGFTQNPASGSSMVMTAPHTSAPLPLAPGDFEQESLWEVPDFEAEFPRSPLVARDASYTTGLTSVQFDVTFSEPVTNVQTSDFALSTDATDGPVASGTVQRVDMFRTEYVYQRGWLPGQAPGSQPFVRSRHPPVPYSGPPTTEERVILSKRYPSDRRATVLVGGVTGPVAGGPGELRLDVLGTGGIVSTAAAGGLDMTTGLTDESGFVILQTAPELTLVETEDASPSVAARVVFSVQFSTSVSEPDLSEFSVATTGTVVASVAELSHQPFGEETLVSVDVASGAGSLRLVFTDLGFVKNAVGMGLAPVPGSFGGADTYVITAVPAPTLVDVLLMHAPVVTFQTAGFRLEFDQVVTPPLLTDFSLVTTGTATAVLDSLVHTTNVISGPSTVSHTRVFVKGISGSGSVRLVYTDSGAVQNARGSALVVNPSPVYTGDTYDVGLTGAVTLSDIELVSATPPEDPLTESVDVVFQLRFSNVVSSPALTDLSLVATGTASGTLSGLTHLNSGRSTSVSVTGVTGSGSLRLVYTDNGNVVSFSGVPLTPPPLNPAFTSDTYSISDVTAPQLSNIVQLLDPDLPLPEASLSELRFRVMFTQHVTGPPSNDFSLVTTGSASANLGLVVHQALGDSTVVSITDVSGVGTVQLVYTDSGSVQNAHAVVLTPPPASPSYSGDTFTITDTPPVILDIERRHATPSTSSTLGFTVTYSQTVSSPADSDFSLVTSGTASADLRIPTAVHGGLGTSTLVFMDNVSGVGNIQLVYTDSGNVANPRGVSLGPLPGSFTGDTYTVNVPPNMRTGALTIGSSGVAKVELLGEEATVARTLDFLVTMASPELPLSAQDFEVLTQGVRFRDCCVRINTRNARERTVRLKDVRGDGTVCLSFPGLTAPSYRVMQSRAKIASFRELDIKTGGLRRVRAFQLVTTWPTSAITRDHLDVIVGDGSDETFRLVVHRRDSVTTEIRADPTDRSRTGPVPPLRLRLTGIDDVVDEALRPLFVRFPAELVSSD